MKPLFRWTVGPCLQQGLDILEVSVRRTTESLGFDNFDWAIMTNGLSGDQATFVKRIIGSLGSKREIFLKNQAWSECPIPDDMQIPRRTDGSFIADGNKCGGTLWKVCPPRVRMESHEIVMDNDVILLKRFPQIDEFLAATAKVMILEEPVRFYGRFDEAISTESPNMNSGFMGFYPGYNFGSEILKSWHEKGRYQHLSQGDEQGLLMYTLSKQPSVRVKPAQMVEILHRDYRTKVTGTEEGVHFTQANRAPNHPAWKDFKERFK